MKKLLGLLIFLYCASCGRSDSADAHLPMAPSQGTSPMKQAVGKEDVWEQIILLLIRDGFVLRVDSVSAVPLTFERYDDTHAVVEAIVLHPSRSRTLTAKASIPLPGTALYTRFSIKEAQFAESTLTDGLVERIERMLSSPDLINEKVYDRIIRLAPDKLLYFSTDAKAFSASVDSYTDSITYLSTHPR